MTSYPQFAATIAWLFSRTTAVMPHCGEMPSHGVNTVSQQYQYSVDVKSAA